MVDDLMGHMYFCLLKVEIHCKSVLYNVIEFALYIESVLCEHNNKTIVDSSSDTHMQYMGHKGVSLRHILGNGRLSIARARVSG